jgi:glycosyltransferase involved in cell wall biosynthesis
MPTATNHLVATEALGEAAAPRTADFGGGTPLISICIPAFNAERYLQETLNSVRLQSFEDWELIVTEDGSEDRTRQIVQKFSGSVTQAVRYQRHDVNKGLPATRNTGISAARGQWIALLDSDDLWSSNHLAMAVEAMRGSRADIIHGGSILFESDSGERIGVRAPSRQNINAFPTSLFCGDYVIQPSSVLIRRDLWDRVGGFDPSFRYVEDREMWLRCARSKAVFAYTGTETCFYRKHGGALTRHAAAMAVASAEVYEKNSDWDELPISLRRRSAAEAWRSAGRIVMRKDPQSARRFFARALRHQLVAPTTFAYLLAAAAFSLGRKET